MIVLGQWLASLVILATSERGDDSAWRLPLITQLIPPGLILVGLPFLAESPSWLINKGRRDDAIKSFLRFNGPKFNVDAAMANAEAAVAQEQEHNKAANQTSWLQCFKGSDGRRTLIICMVYISQQFIGVNFIGSYLVYVYLNTRTTPGTEQCKTVY